MGFLSVIVCPFLCLCECFISYLTLSPFLFLVIVFISIYFLTFTSLTFSPLSHSSFSLLCVCSHYIFPFTGKRGEEVALAAAQQYYSNHCGEYNIITTEEEQ